MCKTAPTESKPWAIVALPKGQKPYIMHTYSRRGDAELHLAWLRRRVRVPELQFVLSWQGNQP